MPIQFNLPDLGENIEAGDVVQLLVREGDMIQAGQNVIELETDKAVVELPCPHAGRVAAIHVKPGDHVPVGALLLTIEAGAGAAAAAPAAAPLPAAPARVPPRAAEKPAPAQAPAPAVAASEAPPARPAAPPAVPPAAAARGVRPAPGATVAASPAVRRIARELGVDLRQVEGSGPGDRVTEEDVRNYVKQVVSTGPSTTAFSPGAPALPDFTQWGAVERRPLRGVRRKSAETVSLAWQIVPHVTQFDLADVTELEAARRQYVSRKRTVWQKAQAAGDATVPPPPALTMTVLVMKALVRLLQQNPQFNASFDAATGEVILKQYYNIGVAVDTEHGLVVPVVRDVDRKGILQLAAELDDLANRTRRRKVDLEELRGGTFTISNLGGIGGTAFTPIVNYPEVAILGIARSRQETVIMDGRPEWRTMLPLCLSYDHRVIDGADGIRFLRSLAAILSDPFDLLL